MSTILFVHAHPDDEASATAGTMARASAEGHRVVAVFATSGDFGSEPADLGEETLVERRAKETAASAEVLGVAAVHWLGYADSGMTGWEQNEGENAFASADVDEAARRLLAIVAAESADVVVGYDWHGNYGHPDHVAVHRVTRRAHELARPTFRLLEATASRDRWRGMRDALLALGAPAEEMDPDGPMDDGNPLGTPESEIQWGVDVRAHLPQKRASLACHASQEKDVTMFLSIPEEVFSEGLGFEYYLEPGLDQPCTLGWPFGPA